jgi:hypothetical protein
MKKTQLSMRFRLLEKWGKKGTNEMYVRKKAKARAKKKAAGTSAHVAPCMRGQVLIVLRSAFWI